LLEPKHAARIAVLLERETSLIVHVQRLLDHPAEVRGVLAGLEIDIFLRTFSRADAAFGAGRAVIVNFTAPRIKQGPLHV
jgi:hypothetical protein